MSSLKRACLSRKLNLGPLAWEQVRAIAATGVDRISIGRLTKDVRAIDYSMRVIGSAPC